MALPSTECPLYWLSLVRTHMALQHVTHQHQHLPPKLEESSWLIILSRLVMAEVMKVPMKTLLEKERKGVFHTGFTCTAVYEWGSFRDLSVRRKVHCTRNCRGPQRAEKNCSATIGLQKCPLTQLLLTTTVAFRNVQFSCLWHNSV